MYITIQKGVASMKVEREQTFGMKVDHEEMQMLEELARMHGMTKSAFVRMVVKQLAMNGIFTVQKGWRENGNV